MDLMVTAWSTWAAILAPLLLLLHFYLRQISSKSNQNQQVPPGSLGWPVIGETLALFRTMKEGSPDRFIRERIEKYGSPIFKTRILGQHEPMVVFSGPAGHKFIFGNENKLVAVWWPPSVQKIFQSCLINVTGDEAKRLKKILMTFLNPDALMRYISTIDQVTRHHMDSHWQGKEEVTVYPVTKEYTFDLACRLFMSCEDQAVVSRLSSHFNIFLKGVIALPLNFPGTRFYRAMRAVDNIRKELLVIIRQRRTDLEQNKASANQDLLSHLLVMSNEEGRFLNEAEIANNIVMLLFAGHDTSCSVLTMLLKYLAEFPHIYKLVLEEQAEIAKANESGKSLQWEDLQKMRYSWHVVSEVMRISPPVSGSFREALVDFTYEGYIIPKGWKIYWNTVAAHRDSTLFPDPMSFEPSRFEDSSSTGPPPFAYVPFGGGPRMCLGKEYARIEILVFLHHIITRFKWDTLIPFEKVEYDPMATPVKGLPIRLYPHSTHNRMEC